MTKSIQSTTQKIELTPFCAVRNCDPDRNKPQVCHLHRIIHKQSACLQRAKKCFRNQIQRQHKYFTISFSKCKPLREWYGIKKNTLSKYTHVYTYVCIHIMYITALIKRYKLLKTHSSFEIRSVRPNNGINLIHKQSHLQMYKSTYLSIWDDVFFLLVIQSIIPRMMRWDKANIINF